MDRGAGRPRWRRITRTCLCVAWPPGETAYPRRSKLFVDPVEGLATIEALYAAHCQMGRNVEELLSCYYWRDEFLEKKP